jgi:hypothetical protein
VVAKLFRTVPSFICGLLKNALINSDYLLSKNINTKIYSTIILPVDLYGCDTWSLISREEHRLKVFEYTVLRKMFGSMRDEVTGETRRLHNEEFHNLYCSPNIIRLIKSRRIKWAGHIACMKNRRGAYRIWMGKPDGRKPRERPRLRWDNNIEMDPQEAWWGMDYIDLAQDRDRSWVLVKAIIKLRVP